jgi:hypothetical protein
VGEPWEPVLEGFVNAGLDKLHEAYGATPWFWGQAWPAIFGAAAAEWWMSGPASAPERHAVAYNYAQVRWEELLVLNPGCQPPGCQPPALNPGCQPPGCQPPARTAPLPMAPGAKAKPVPAPPQGPPLQPPAPQPPPGGPPPRAGQLPSYFMAGKQWVVCAICGDVMQRALWAPGHCAAREEVGMCQPPFLHCAGCGNDLCVACVPDDCWMDAIWV